VPSTITLQQGRENFIDDVKNDIEKKFSDFTKYVSDFNNKIEQNFKKLENSLENNLTHDSFIKLIDLRFK
jgi:hypothetical protein